MEEKILDPTAWFQCRYCLKCIQGMNAFIDHKRENHTEEFYRDREEKSRQAAQEDQRKGRVENEPKQKKIRVATGSTSKGSSYDGTQGTVVVQGGPQKKPRRILTNHAAELRTHSPSPPDRCGATSPNRDVCLNLNTDKEISEPVKRKALYADEGEEQGNTCFVDSESSGIDIQNSEDHGYQAPALVFKPTDNDVEDEVVIVHDDADVGNSIPRQRDICVMTSVKNLVTAAEQPQNCQATNDNSQVNLNSHSSRMKARMSSDNSPRSSRAAEEKYGTAIAVYLPNQNLANEDADKSKGNPNRYSQDDSSSDDEVSIVATKIPEYPHYRKVGVSLFRYCNKFGVIGEVFPIQHHGSSPQENGNSNKEVVIYEAAMSHLSQSSSGIQADMDISTSDIEPEISDSEIYTAEDGIEPDFTKLFELHHASFDTVRMTTADEKAEEQAEGKSEEMLPIENSKLKYACLSCDQTFPNDREQRLHWSEEHDNFLPYQCKLCSENFTQESMLATHMIAHYEHHYSNCEQKFVENLDVHEEAIPRKKVEMDNLKKSEEPTNENPSPETPETSLIQNNVGLEKRVYGEARAIAKGIKRGRGPHKRYKCPYCLKTAMTKGGLVQHLRIHTGEMPFKCRYCDSTFRYSASCAAHEKRHPNHQPESTTYECKHCPVVFRTFIECNNHEMRHTNNDPYGCRSCPRFFPTLSLLNHHEMIEHHRSAEISVNNINISGSETVVDVRQGLEESKDMIIEDSDGENSFSFDSMEPVKFQAGVSPIEAGSVIQSKTGRKKHPCSACSIVYSTRRELRHHKKYQCPKKFEKYSLSDKNSTQGSDPNNIYINIRSFKCSKCPRTFSYARNLAKHKRFCKRSPKKTPELTCQFCGRVFTSSIARRCHENIHTGNKPFKCHLCPRAFSHFSYLYPHIASVHKGAKKVKLFSNVKTAADVAAEGNGTSSNPAVGSSSKATLSPNLSPSKSSRNSKQKPESSKMTTSVGYDGSGSGSETPDSRDDDPDLRVTAYQSRAVRRSRLTTRKKRLTCKQCGTGFTKGDNYKAHIARVHCGNECEICGKTYASKQSLNRHKKDHLTKPCSCTVCRKLFASDDKLQLHIVRRHSQPSPFPCLCCKKKFMKAEELETHYHVAHVQKKTSYKCVFCSMEFSSSSSLWEHTGKNQCLRRGRRSRKSTVKKPPVLKLQTETGSQVSIVVNPEIFSDAEQNQCEGNALEETGEMTRATEDDRRDQAIGATASQVRLEESGNCSPLTEPPHLEREDLNEDSEECMDIDAEFYFKCSICKAEFTNNVLAELHIRWHREEFKKLCGNNVP